MLPSFQGIDGHDKSENLGGRGFCRVYLLWLEPDKIALVRPNVPSRNSKCSLPGIRRSSGYESKTYGCRASV